MTPPARCSGTQPRTSRELGHLPGSRGTDSGGAATEGTWGARDREQRPGARLGQRPSALLTRRHGRRVRDARAGGAEAPRAESGEGSRSRAGIAQGACARARGARPAEGGREEAAEAGPRLLRPLARGGSSRARGRSSPQPPLVRRRGLPARPAASAACSLGRARPDAARPGCRAGVRADAEMSAAAPAPERGWKSEKVDEAQALARSCAARRPDFQPCDGLSICATHSHGKCFKLHWCCHLGWCHCKSSGVSAPSFRGRGGDWVVAVGLRALRGSRCPTPGQGCPRLGWAVRWQRGRLAGQSGRSHFSS